MTSPAAPTCLNDADVIRLVALMGPSNIALLVTLIDAINKDSGFGAITLVLAHGRVEEQKRTQSFRSRDVIINKEE